MPLNIKQVSVERISGHGASTVSIGRMQVEVDGVAITMQLDEAVCAQIMKLSEPLARSTFLKLAEDASE